MIHKASLLLATLVFGCTFTSALAQTDAPPSAFARTLSHIDLGVSGAGMFTRTVSGPIIPVAAPDYGSTVEDQTSNTLGAVVTLRYVVKPYVGFEMNGTYARYTENYISAAPYQVQTRADEYTVGYLVTPSNTFFGLNPYASAGVGTIEFKPTAHGGQGQLSQGRLAAYYSVGVQHDLNKTFGLRVGFRQLFFMDPDFFANYLQIEKRTFTLQPTAGFYMRF